MFQHNLVEIVSGYGTLESVAGLTVEEQGNGAFHKTILTLNEVAMASTDAGANGAQTTLKLYTFPEGHLIILGGHQVYPLGKIAATTGGCTGYLDTANLGIGVGSDEANAGVGLAGAEENICAEADVDLTAKTSDAIESSVNAAIIPLDGSAAAIAAWLNTSTLADGDHGAVADTLTVSGTITILWALVGDD